MVAENEQWIIILVPDMTIPTSQVKLATGGMMSPTLDTFT